MKVVYLNAKGGLCNRVRAMDSMMSLCKKYGCKLIVIWEQNKELNCAFEDIFEFPRIENLDLEIVNTRPFQLIPRNGIMKIHKLGYFFTKAHINVRIELSRLANLYNSKKHTTEKKTIHEMDDIFFGNVKPILDEIFNSDNEKSAFVTSCYPLYPNTDGYSNFKPVPHILKKIDQATAGFGANTIGVHIRRTDHTVSKAFSSDDKFFNIIDKESRASEDNNFFICTDEKKIKDVLESKYKGKIYTNELSSYSRNEKSAIEDAVLDLFCLSRTCKVYGSYGSTFSQVAADIGGIEEISLK